MCYGALTNAATYKYESILGITNIRERYPFHGTVRKKLLVNC
jgi:hypothetical protein